MFGQVTHARSRWKARALIVYLTHILFWQQLHIEIEREYILFNIIEIYVRDAFKCTKWHLSDAAELIKSFTSYLLQALGCILYMHPTQHSEAVLLSLVSLFSLYSTMWCLRFLDFGHLLLHGLHTDVQGVIHKLRNTNLDPIYSPFITPKVPFYLQFVSGLSTSTPPPSLVCVTWFMNSPFELFKFLFDWKI